MMSYSNLNVEKINHRGEYRIALQLSYDKEKINKVKQIPGRKWSQTKNCWHIPYTTEAFKALKDIFGEVIINSPNKEEHTQSFESKNRRPKEEVQQFQAAGKSEWRDL